MNQTDPRRPGEHVLKPMELQVIGCTHALGAPRPFRWVPGRGGRARPDFAVWTFELLAVEAVVAFDSIRGIAQLRLFDALEG